MKAIFSLRRTVAPSWAAAVLLLSAAPLRATSFELRERPPGPGHPVSGYWWHFNQASWLLTTPEGFVLTGGGELLLAEKDKPALVAVCRQSTDAERALLAKGDKQAQAEYVRTLLPSGVKDVQLVSQAKNPLGVNGLTNFEAVYAYTLGGRKFQWCCMVSQGGEDLEQLPPVPGQPTPAPTPAPPPGVQPVRTGEFFTAIIACGQVEYATLYNGYQRLLGTAKLRRGDAAADEAAQYAAHGMLGR